MVNRSSQDNKLIWESFMDNSPQEDEGFNYGEDDFESEFDDDFGDDDFGDEDDGPEVVMEIEPIGPVEAEDEYNEDNQMIYSDVKKIAEYSDRLLPLVKSGELDDWMVAKLIKAADYVSDVWHSLDSRADFANTGRDQSDDMEEF